MRRFVFIALGCAAVRFATPEPLAGGVEFPFDYRDGFMRVDVALEGRPERFTFLFDTGAAVSVLNLRTVTRLGLRTGRPVLVRGVRSEAIGYWPTRVPARVGPVALSGEFLAADLNEVSDACNEGVDGLVGADFLRDRVVQIDFERRRIRLLEPRAVPSTGEVVPLRITRSGVCIPIRVDDGDARWVRLDTGCASALHWVTPDAKLQAGPIAATVALSEADLPKGCANIRLGALRFDGVPISVRGQGLFPGEYGLLGNGLLSRFATVTLDARSKRLVLQGSETMH